MPKPTAFLLLCLLVWSACKQEPVTPQVENRFEGQVISQITGAGLPGVPVLFQSYYTANGRAYLSDTTLTTDAEGRFVYVETYPVGRRTAYADSVGADSADLFYLLGLDAPLAALQAYQSDGSPIPPINARLNPDLTITYEVVPTVGLPIQFEDSAQHDREVRLEIRELFPVQDTLRSRYGPYANYSGAGTVVLVEGRDTELRTLVYDRPPAPNPPVLRWDRRDTLRLSGAGPHPAYGVRY